MQASFLTKRSDRFAASLDVRLKLLLCFTGALTSIFFSSPLTLLVLLAGSAALALSAATPRLLAIVVLAATAMMVMATGFSWLVSLAMPGMFKWNLLLMTVPYLRMLVVVTLILPLAVATPIQTVVATLNASHLPGIITIPLSVAIRFVPSFLDDCKQIRDVTRLRPGNGLLSAWRGIIVPLMFRILTSADDLAMSAELKGLSPSKKITVSPASPFSQRDYMVLGAAVILLAVATAIQLWGPQAPVMPRG